MSTYWPPGGVDVGSVRDEPPCGFNGDMCSGKPEDAWGMCACFILIILFEWKAMKSANSLYYELFVT